jgi:hypothetical protein
MVWPVKLCLKYNAQDKYIGIVALFLVSMQLLLLLLRPAVDLFLKYRLF